MALLRKALRGSACVLVATIASGNYTRSTTNDTSDSLLVHLTDAEGTQGSNVSWVAWKQYGTDNSVCQGSRITENVVADLAACQSEALANRATFYQYNLLNSTCATLASCIPMEGASNTSWRIYSAPSTRDTRNIRNTDDTGTLPHPSGKPATPTTPIIPEPDRNQTGSFEYHKWLLPLDWHHDGITLCIASVGLVIAASGGIGGGGILVPIFMLFLRFRPKHAIALSNFTIFGGAIANTLLNARKRHPSLNRPLIDWDIIVMMEPLTIFGAVFGALMSKVLPNIVLTVSLVAVLAYMGRHTLQKGCKMWREESLQKAGGSAMLAPRGEDAPAVVAQVVELSGLQRSGANDDDHSETERPYLELQSDEEKGSTAQNGPGQSDSQKGVFNKIAILTLCFVGIIVLTILKGGGNFPSPFGFECGSPGYWLLYFGSVPWVLGFALYFRSVLMAEFHQKVLRGHVFGPGEVQWSAGNSVRYPLLCALSGLLAGLFGVGGGIVKGPLMLEMGVIPVVASASAAAMILYTSAAASTSFIVFGLLHPSYGALFFATGFICTLFGQYTVSRWVKKHRRQSPIVLSIGTVISLSAALVALETGIQASEMPFAALFRIHGVCTAAVE